MLRGAQRFLREVRPLFICEVLDMVTRSWGYSAREIVTQMQTHDYDWFDIGQDGSIAPHRTQSEYAEVRNYLAIPERSVIFVHGILNSPVLSSELNGTVVDRGLQN